MLKRLLVGLALLASSAVANAADVPLTCTAPSTYTDTSPIVPGTSILFKFYRGSTAAAATAATTPIGTSTTCSYVDVAVPPGTQFYAATASVAGVESVKTATISVTIPNPTPNPPSNLAATIRAADTNAYKMRVGIDGYQMIAIGKFPEGTQCLSQTAGEYTVVPRSAVTLNNRFDTLPTVVYGRCS